MIDRIDCGDVWSQMPSNSPPLPFFTPLCGVKGYDKGTPGSGYIESGST
jgi:hypothetical protein